MDILLKAILKEEKKEELKKNNIIIKNGIFKINDKQKKKLEEELEHSFKKNYFSDKNIFLYNGVKNKLEELGFTFKTEEELEEEVEKYIEKLEKEEEVEEEKEKQKKNQKKLEKTRKNQKKLEKTRLEKASFKKLAFFYIEKRIEKK